MAIQNPSVPDQADERQDLIRMVQGIVLAQGNSFIKELLRHNRIRIGTTKADFEENLIAAIHDGRLRRQQITDWLEEVEGWGDQHIFLYKVPQTLARDPLFGRPERIVEKLRDVGREALWNADASLRFPPELEIVGVYSDADGLRMKWQQGKEWWQRDTTKDYQEELEGDLFEFRAYRRLAERTVMRFELRPELKLAAIFIRATAETVSFEEAIRDVQEAVNWIFDFDQLPALNIQLAVKRLDAVGLEDRQNNSGIRSRQVRLNAPGAYIEFASTAAGTSYQDLQSVRDVRRAVEPQRFQGGRSEFLFSPTRDTTLVRPIKVTLYGEQERIRLWAQMRSFEVWEVLRLIKENL